MRLARIQVNSYQNNLIRQVFDWNSHSFNFGLDKQIGDILLTMDKTNLIAPKTKAEQELIYCNIVRYLDLRQNNLSDDIDFLNYVDSVLVKHGAYIYSRSEFEATNQLSLAKLDLTHHNLGYALYDAFHWWNNLPSDVQMQHINAENLFEYPLDKLDNLNTFDIKAFELYKVIANQNTLVLHTRQGIDVLCYVSNMYLDNTKLINTDAYSKQKIQLMLLNIKMTHLLWEVTDEVTTNKREAKRNRQFHKEYVEKHRGKTVHSAPSTFTKVFKKIYHAIVFFLNS